MNDKLSDFELNTFEKYIDTSTVFILAFGNNEFRLQWCEQITKAGGSLATIIHPSAYVSPKARIRAGVVILPYAMVNTGTIVNEGCIINIGAIVDHDCILEPGVHIVPGAIVKGENHVPRCEKKESGVVVERATMK